MPTYEYECSKCGGSFEFSQSMKSAPLTRCELCGEEGGVKRLISAGSGLIFKGSGFYITDYKNKNGNGGSSNGKSDESQSGPTKVAESKSESTSAPKTEAKTESKTPSTSATPAKE